MSDCCGPITPATRTFLSRNRLYQRTVSVALNRARLKGAQPEDRRRRIFLLDGTSRRHLKIRGWRYLEGAVLKYDPRSGNTLLKIDGRKFQYRELRDGTAQLVRFGIAPPETIWVGWPASLRTLGQLLEAADKPFYCRSDPIILSTPNGIRGGRQGHIVRFRPQWAEANWRYTSGRALVHC